MSLTKQKFNKKKSIKDKKNCDMVRCPVESLRLYFLLQLFNYDNKSNLTH